MHLSARKVLLKNPMWKTGLASSMWAKWPGQSFMFPAQVWQREKRSTTPWRGSRIPSIFGRFEAFPKSSRSVASGWISPGELTTFQRYFIIIQRFEINDKNSIFFIFKIFPDMRFISSGDSIPNWTCLILLKVTEDSVCCAMLALQQFWYSLSRKRDQNAGGEKRTARGLSHYQWQCFHFFLFRRKFNTLFCHFFILYSYLQSAL